MRFEYRGWIIQMGYDPTPLKRDWFYWHSDYDGPEDRRCGSAETMTQAKADIDDAEDEAND